MILLYNIVFIIYALIVFPYLLLTGRMYAGFKERFGIFSYDLLKCLGRRKTVWAHAVSVGEVMAIEPFIRHIKAQKPQLDIVLTVSTKTGYQLAKTKIFDIATIVAAPLDLSFITNRFVDVIKPCVYIAAETEIWPNLYTSLSKRHVPISVINARISDRSFGRYKMASLFLKHIFTKVNLFAAQSSTDEQRLIELGALPNNVFAVGNIKFDQALQVTANAVDEKYQPAWPVLMAGSTHPGEEKILLDVFGRLKGDFPQWQLVIVPRHVERTLDIVSFIQHAGMKVVLYSRLGQDIDPQAVVVVDVIGKLRTLYKSASIVFIGKTLCVGGGQNMIEPAFYAKPVVVGPLTENFRDIIHSFKKSQAIVQVANSAELELKLRGLMEDADLRMELGQKARAVIDANQGVIVKTYQLIESFL